MLIAASLCRILSDFDFIKLRARELEREREILKDEKEKINKKINNKKLKNLNP